ncbi:hypothetical protein Asulf_01320 [Archaeoglobus sulfaticallidus PM70-1]|uniref:Uncharacterized protein n=1 Tax=Archaeoglobus sulfaticallidus PM70-1 TaxID=387631 RepID=N0BL92_9EURY|nr:hypothetical protein [Archaeoglobus sulfaticallidus]AGK61311.1 hypothetical protein Asulf_01320 [Archaeoglobus sulfaticallidus PM70-1]
MNGNASKEALGMEKACNNSAGNAYNEALEMQAVRHWKCMNGNGGASNGNGKCEYGTRISYMLTISTYHQHNVK